MKGRIDLLMVLEMLFVILGWLMYIQKVTFIRGLKVLAPLELLRNVLTALLLLRAGRFSTLMQF